MKRFLLFVVLLVIAVAAYRFYSQKTQVGVDRVQVRAQTQQITANLNDFANKNGGRLPQDWKELIAATGMDPAILRAPGSDSEEPGWDLLMPGVKMQEIRNSNEHILVVSRFEVEKGMRLAIFADGHVETIAAEDIPPDGVPPKEPLVAEPSGK